MREIILVGAPWCGACKAMKVWFDGLSYPGVTLRYVDVNDAQFVDGESASTLPTVMFVEDGLVVQKIAGAVGQPEFERITRSLWIGA